MGSNGESRLAARIAPQRSTQYAALADALAMPELELSPLGARLASAERVIWGGQDYLSITLEGAGGPIPAFATLTDWFDLLSDGAGPLLRPRAMEEALSFGDELVMARRYRGKTNELFTHFMVNVARWLHGGEPRWLLDPLSGGGTTLFTGLRLGLDVIGIELDKTSHEGTDLFLKQYLEEERLKHKRVIERRRAGARTLVTMPQSGRHAVLALGDSRDAATLLEGLPGAPRPELIVTDLPYAIQHGARGSFKSLLAEALPAWRAVAAPGALLVMAWNATTTPRERIVEAVVAAGWDPLSGGPLDALAHRVDRVIKQRDVIVARG